MEKIIVRIEVDGVEQSSIEMGEGKQDEIYQEDIVFSEMGHVFNKEHTSALYDYMIRLTRRKTNDEKAQAQAQEDKRKREQDEALRKERESMK